MLAFFRTVLVAIAAFLLNNWWRVVLAIVALVLIWNYTGTVLQGIMWVPQAFDSKLNEWKTVIAAPWPTPVPVVSPDHVIGGNPTTGGLDSKCEMQTPDGLKISTVNDTQLQWYTLDNANRALLLCNGRIKRIFAVIPPEHFNDWQQFLPAELQGLNAPDIGVPAVPVPAQPLNRNQQLNGNPPPAVTAVPGATNANCPLFGGHQTNRTPDGLTCLYQGPVITADVPSGWWAWWGIPAHRQDSGSITANQVSFYPN